MEIRMALCASVLAIGIGAPCSAYALETGQCRPAAEVRAAITAEAQNPVVVGNQAGYGRPYALVFTSNKDGSRGYALRGDKPFGEVATTICIDSIFHDVKLNDFTKPGLPSWARLQLNEATATDTCRRNRLGYQEECAPYRHDIEGQTANGQRVAFMAKGTAINPRDKSVRQDQWLVLTLTSEDGGGLVQAVTPDGASYMLSGYTKGSFTQHSAGLMRR